jgi:hypothetical protein
LVDVIGERAGKRLADALGVESGRQLDCFDECKALDGERVEDELETGREKRRLVGLFAAPHFGAGRHHRIDAQRRVDALRVQGIESHAPRAQSRLDHVHAATLLDVVAAGAEADDLIRERAMRIDKADPAPSEDILPDQVFEEFRLSGSTGADHVHMPRTLLVRYPVGLAPALAD